MHLADAFIQSDLQAYLHTCFFSSIIKIIIIIKLLKLLLKLYIIIDDTQFIIYKKKLK